jgi:hypothetical protein
MRHNAVNRTPLGPFGAVAVLRWPEQDADRRRLAALGRPRVLLTTGDVVPPSLLDDREAWIPDGSDVGTLLEAVENLDRMAALAPGRPLLDADGLLRHAGHWVEIPRAQLGIVAVLVENYQRLVTNDALREAYERSARSTSTASLNGLVQRLGTRMARVGLDLRRVRRRGVVLGPAPSPDALLLPRDAAGTTKVSPTIEAITDAWCRGHRGLLA